MSQRALQNRKLFFLYAIDLARHDEAEILSKNHDSKLIEKKTEEKTDV